MTRGWNHNQTCIMLRFKNVSRRQTSWTTLVNWANNPHKIAKTLIPSHGWHCNYSIQQKHHYRQQHNQLKRRFTQMRIQKKKTVDISLLFWPQEGMHKFYYQIISPANIAIVNTQSKKANIYRWTGSICLTVNLQLTIRMSSKKHRVFLSANIIYCIVFWKSCWHVS